MIGRGTHWAYARCSLLALAASEDEIFADAPDERFTPAEFAALPDAKIRDAAATHYRCGRRSGSQTLW